MRDDFRFDAGVSVGSGPGARRLDEAARRFYAPLASFFRKRVRNSGDAQDLVQQVFLRLSRHPDLAAIERPDAYIFQVASTALKDHRHRGDAQKRMSVGMAARHEDDSDFSRERVLLGQEQGQEQGQEHIDLAIAALRRLPERTRDVFILRIFDGLQHAEIAWLMGVSVRCVEKHACRALTAVARALEQHP